MESNFLAVAHFNVYNKRNIINNKAELADIEKFYIILMKYRLLVYNTLNQHSGVLTASSLGYKAALNLTKPINKLIYKRIKHIDNILAQIIDRKALIIQDQYLVDNYQFPVANLDEIDFEYL